ncbi:MAG: ribonuclease HI family protein [Candidatus Micrarchaeales archaeon]
MDYLVVFTDGASRGNPGKAACGFYIKGVTKLPKVYYLGERTNNFAEYLAIIKALEFLKSERVKNARVRVISDSKLVINQIKGNFKIKNKNLIPLAKRIKEILKELKENGVEVYFENKSRKTKGIAYVDKALNLFLDTK